MQQKKQKENRRPLRWPPFGDAGVRRANLVLFLVCVLLFHLAVYALSARFSWYFYTEEKYTHEIGAANADKLDEMEHAVTVRFCMEEEDLKADTVYSLVYKTAEQYADRHAGKVTILPSLNIYTDHREVAAYKERIDESDVTISRETVIVESEKDIRLFRMSDFFLLDSEQRIKAYNGEEVFCAAFLWVQVPQAQHPAVYYTIDHGETVALLAMQSKLLLAGYRPEAINLSSDAIPADCAVIVISNPLYDFEVAAPGSHVESELDRLTAFVDGGGKLIVTLDAAKESYASLENLRAFLADYGMTAGDTVLSDMENAVTQDGKVFLASAVAHEGRLLLREPAALTLSATNKKNAALLPAVTGFATVEKDGAAGNHTIAAMAEVASGGRIFFATTGYLFYNDALESGVYANRDFLYGILTEFGCRTAPAGSRILPVASDTLENLTMGEANTVFALTAAALPALVILACVAVMLRRRFR